MEAPYIENPRYRAITLAPDFPVVYVNCVSNYVDS